MSTTILLLDAFATSATSSRFLGLNNSQAFTTALAAPQLVQVDGAASASPRTGKLPRRVAAHNREALDPDYRERMQQARVLLAEEMDELAPDSLAKLRLRRGMSQTQLAVRIGTSQSHIAKIEGGAVKLFWQTATRLADALSVSLDTLRPLVDISHTGSNVVQPSPVATYSATRRHQAATSPIELILAD